MKHTEPGQDQDAHIRHILRRTRVSMALESALRAFWPTLSAIGAIWAALAFGVAGEANPLWMSIGLATGLACLVFFAWRGVRRFRWPSRSAAIARLDTSLPGRPLAALDDKPALGADDPAVEKLWATHRARMLERARAAAPVPADLRLAREDPWALRLSVLVFFIAAAVFTRLDNVDTVAEVFGQPGSTTAEAGPSYEGWAEPPLYTGRPTLYLPEIADKQTVSLPKGTAITLRAYGEESRFSLTETVSESDDAAFAQAADGIAIAEFTLSDSGQITLERAGRELASWSFEIEPDDPPTIALSEPVERAPGGAMRLSFRATDDHGVTEAEARITLDLSAVDRRYGLTPEPEPRDALVLPLPLPLSGSMLEIEETLVDDLSKHPWAGLPVSITLAAGDALEQEGIQAGIRAELPGRNFYDPAAAALAEQRRDLLWSVENAPRVAKVLRAVSWRPEGLFDSSSAYLITRTVIRRLDLAIETGTVAEKRDEFAEALWRAAVLLEDGSLGDAADRLAKAKERLQEALRGDATDEEIAELMEELREATRDYMEQMAREALENGDMEMAEAPPEGQSMNQDQLQEMMDRIQELSEQGRRAEAEALLEMLQRMLENMEMRFTQGGEGQSGEGQQSMQGLADALREQQGLADDSFEQLQRQFREGQQGNQGQPGQPGQGQQGQGQPGQGESNQSLAERQEALRQLLEELQENLPGSAGEATRDLLGDAERSMDSAREGLEQGDTSQALDDQSEAIDNLRQGMQSLSQDIRQAEGSQGGQESPNGSARSENPTDPLGRPAGSTGGTRTDSQMLPEGADAAARAREILDEIRRRSGDLSRPEIELDYLRRLLDRF
ncbi:TIGR02302 family protein [Amaricoccus macauensis]|uniref:TIGR02302 family protein n=1 Tax=Amaricoccus macauensis TaxID=57001 RepID=UPI003C7C5364